jgi:beta-fructofuranosidase
MIAVSSDPLLLNWEKIGDGPVIPLSTDTATPYRVFDPCIWRTGNHYYSLSAGYTHHRPSGRRLRADFLFRSEDLRSWEYLHPFVDDDVFGLPGDDGACPYFWPIGRRHMLLHFSHMSGGKYILGDYDTKQNKLIAASGGRFNFGAFGPGGVHAPSATPDGTGGLIVIFNMNPAKPTGEWNQIMSLPRRLTLEGDENLRVEPAGDVDSLRRAHVHLDERGLPANEEVVLHDLVGHTAEIAAVIDPVDAPTIEVNVLRSESERTRITLYPQRGFRDWRKYTGWEREKHRAARDSIVTIDTVDSSLAPDVLSRPPESAPVHLAPEEPFDLRIFVDRSVVEVFVNRRQCAAVRVYPSRPDSNGVSIRAHGSEARLLGLDFWQLDTIYASR